MRWPIFAMFAFVAVVAQLSVRNAMTLYSVLGISPDVVMPLAVFIALFAQRTSALWGCMILGLLMDLAPREHAEPYHLLGIHALGYAAAGYMVLQMRTMVFRRRSVTVGFLTFLGLLVASLVAVMLLAIRSWYPGAEAYGPLSDLGRRFLIALYSGVVAVPVGRLLGLTVPLWGFQSNAPRRGGW